MTFNLPAYGCAENIEGLENAVETGRDGDVRQYRLNDFDGLNDHDKLLRKLAIMQARGTYTV